MQFPLADRIRCQETRFILQVPNGKSVFLRGSSRRMLDDIANTTNTYDDEMVDHLWTMTPEGLTLGTGTPAAPDSRPPAPPREPAPAENPGNHQESRLEITAERLQERAATTAELAAAHMPNLIEMLTAGLRP